MSPRPEWTIPCIYQNPDAVNKRDHSSNQIPKRANRQDIPPDDCDQRNIGNHQEIVVRLKLKIVPAPMSETLSITVPTTPLYSIVTPST